jgi:hypothetical protein
MICSNCANDFPEKDIQESHDVPCYLFNGKTRKERKNQADKFGRRWLCKKCHDIYEKTLPWIIVSGFTEEEKQRQRDLIQKFASDYFGRKGK